MQIGQIYKIIVIRMVHNKKCNFRTGKINCTSNLIAFYKSSEKNFEN